MNKVTYHQVMFVSFNLVLKTGINNLKFTESRNSQTSPKPAFCKMFLTYKTQCSSLNIKGYIRTDSVNILLFLTQKHIFHFLRYCLLYSQFEEHLKKQKQKHKQYIS